ncbi:MAG: DUF6089 family protein [Bacteroidota bacterium]
MSTFRLFTLAVLFPVFICIFPQVGRAQLVMKGLEVGPWGGVSYYLGDLNTNFRLNRPNVAGGFMARYNFNNRIATRLSFGYGHVEAYDSDSQNPFERIRNLSFQSDIFEGTAQIEFNFLPYIHGSYDYFFTPYVFAGITIFDFDPKTVRDNGELVSLVDLGTEGQLRGQDYLTLSSAIAYGVGIKWDINFEWSMDLFISARNTNTDYLDDVSTVYPDQSDLARSRGPVAIELYDRSLEEGDLGGRDREGEQRGDDTNKDNYFFIGLGVQYYFGDVRCPRVNSKRRRRN